jgi:hypothetical protein
MGTSNFHNENASKIFALTGDEDEFAFNDTILNVTSEFDKEDCFTGDDSISLDSELRSFPAKSIGSFALCLYYAGVDLEVEVIPLVRGGYYEGFNLDYEIKFMLNGLEMCTDCQEPNIDSIEYVMKYSHRKGFVSLQKKNIENKLTAMVKILTEKVEKVFENYSDQLNVVGTFSNGETIYEVV